jgi:hypothetical protein
VTHPDNPEPGVHVRVDPTANGVATADEPTSDLEPGVYRVVGRGDGSVTLLLVGDPDGERTHTGRIDRVTRTTFDRLDPVEPPESSTLRTIGVGVSHSVRAVPSNLRTRPGQVALAVALLLAPVLGPPELVAPTVLEIAELAGAALLGAAAAGLPR